MLNFKPGFSFTQSCPTLFNTIDCSTPVLSVPHHLPKFPKFMSIELLIPSKNRILCPPLLLPPSFFPSIGVSSNESVLCIRWPKYWSFSFRISPSKEHQGLISFRMDSLDLLAVQHNSKALILQHSAFFLVQL